MKSKTPNIVYDTSPTEDVCLAQRAGEKHEKRDSFFKRFIRNTYTNFLWLKLKNRYSAQLPHTPSCVVICTGGNLGGAILSLPLIQAARLRWPDAHLAVVGNTSHSIEVVKLLNLGDSHYVLENLSWKESFLNLRPSADLKALIQLKPDVVISNHNFTLDARIAFLRAPVRVGHVGYSPSGDKLLWDKFFNIRVPSVPGRNWLDSYADITKIFGVPSITSPKIILENQAKANAKERLQHLGLGQGALTVAIQAGVWEKQMFKQWPVEFLAQTCLSLWSELNMIPVILGGKGQEVTTQFIRERLPEDALVIDLVGKTTVLEAASVLSLCTVTLANDSGLMHLSAAVGTPTIALYGMTDPDITWCYEEAAQHRLIRRQDCRPCYSFDADLIAQCASRSCLRNIHPDLVTRTVLDVVAKTEGSVVITEQQEQVAV